MALYENYKGHLEITSQVKKGRLGLPDRTLYDKEWEGVLYFVVSYLK